MHRARRLHGNGGGISPTERRERRAFDINQVVPRSSRRRKVAYSGAVQTHWNCCTGPLKLRSRIQRHEWLTMRVSRERDEAGVPSIIPGSAPTLEVEFEGHQQGEVIR